MVENRAEERVERKAIPASSASTYTHTDPAGGGADEGRSPARTGVKPLGTEYFLQRARRVSWVRSRETTRSGCANERETSSSSLAAQVLRDRARMGPSRVAPGDQDDEDAMAAAPVLRRGWQACGANQGRWQPERKWSFQLLFVVVRKSKWLG